MAMKWIAVAVLALSATTGVTGCSPSKSEPVSPAPVQQDANNRDYSEKHILLSDGRVVVCLEWRSGASASDARGGISCDWQDTKGTK